MPPQRLLSSAKEVPDLPDLDLALVRQAHHVAVEGGVERERSEEGVTETLQHCGRIGGRQAWTRGTAGGDVTQPPADGAPTQAHGAGEQLHRHEPIDG